MGDLFRSEEMSFVEMNFLDAAKEDTIMALGAFGKFHPVDVRSRVRFLCLFP